MSLDLLGKCLIFLGALLAVIGGGLLLAARVPFLGRLPGDMSFQRDGFSLYIPLATSVLVSIALTILINVVLRLTGK